MATGKTNARYITIDVEDAATTQRDISTDVTDISIPVNYDQMDVTGYSDGVHNVTMGHPNQPLTMSGHLNNTANTGAHSVFVGTNAILGVQSATFTITIQIGIKAVPAGGDPEYEGEFYLTDYTVNGDLTWSATFMPATATAPAWGTV